VGHGAFHEVWQHNVVGEVLAGKLGTRQYQSRPVSMARWLKAGSVSTMRHRSMAEYSWGQDRQPILVLARVNAVIVSHPVPCAATCRNRVRPPCQVAFARWERPVAALTLPRHVAEGDPEPALG
jgi:hypothetical protein